MKIMFKSLADAAKENPREFIYSAILLLGIAIAFTVAIWFDAVINGRV